MNTKQNIIDMINETITDIEFEGVSVAIYRSEVKGKLSVQIDTSEYKGEDENDPDINVFFNDAIATEWEAE